MADLSGGSVVWNLDVDSKKLSAGLNDAKTQVDKTAKDIDGSVSSLSQGIIGHFKAAEGASLAFAGAFATVAASIAGVIGFGVKFAADLETSRQGFITLLGSAEKADAAIAKIKKDAASTPFELPGLIKANQLLTSVTKDADRSERFLLNIGKALAAMGKGQPELDRIIVNLQQIGSVGKASMLDIKQFAFAGIPIFELLKQEVEKTTRATVDNSKAIGKKSDELTKLQGQLKVAEQRQKEFNDKTKESTKIQNQNQIDSYRKKISSLTGDVSNLTAANGKLSQSQGNLEDAIKDGKITFELLEKVFNDAGEGQGRFSRAFIDQAGTFNQLFSNLKDNIGILAGDLVTQTGIFDAVKRSIGDLVEAIASFTPDIIATIKDFITFAQENSPILAGAIAGALTPAFVGLAAAVATNIALLTPYVVAGAALALVISEITELLGGWEAAQQKVSSALSFVAEVFRDFLGPQLNELGRIIKSELMPELRELWGFISPILIPTLKFLGVVITGTILGALTLFTQLLTGAVGLVADVIKVFNELIKFFTGMPNAISDALRGVGEAIAKPFRDAKAKVDEITKGIKESLDRVNPYHRESPSLVDNVMSGVKDIKEEFKTLGNVDIPPVTGAVQVPQVDSTRLPSISTDPMVKSGSRPNQTITIHIGQVNDNQDVEKIGREIAFKAALLPAP